MQYAPGGFLNTLLKLQVGQCVPSGVILANLALALGVPMETFFVRTGTSIPLEYVLERLGLEPTIYHNVQASNGSAPSELAACLAEEWNQLQISRSNFHLMYSENPMVHAMLVAFKRVKPGKETVVRHVA